MAGITLGKNIPSLAAQRWLNRASREVGDSIAQLSSGLRINRPGDDAAGVAVAADLEISARVYTQGVRNLNDAISALNIADGAIKESVAIVTRLSELAAQASNGTYSQAQRQALDAEAQALRDEYIRISSISKFNGRNLVDGSNSSLVIQSGFGNSEMIELTLPNLITTTTTTLVGDGTFGNAVSYSGGGSSIFDINGDGYLDIIGTDQGGDAESVLLNNGDSTFRAETTFATDSSPTGRGFGDLNGDGNYDLVVATNANALDVLLGNGNGSFKSRTSFAAGSNGFDGQLLDLNGDGNLDAIATAHTDDKIDVWFGNGNGSFKARRSFSVGDGPIQVTIADVNGDGNSDFITANTADDTTSILLGNGNGTFKSFTSYFVADNARATVGDVNGDGVLDIVGTGFTGGSVNILIGGQGNDIEEQ